MTQDRQAALRDFFLAVAAILDVPQPLSHADDDLYTIALTGAEVTVLAACRHLINGPLDNLAIHDEARVLRGLPTEVAYPTARRPVTRPAVAA